MVFFKGLPDPPFTTMLHTSIIWMNLITRSIVFIWYVLGSLSKESKGRKMGRNERGRESGIERESAPGREGGGRQPDSWTARKKRGFMKYPIEQT